MTRTGWIVLAALLLVGIAVASITRVTGPGAGRVLAAEGVAAPAEAASPAEPLVVPVRGVARATLVDSWGDPRGGGRAHHALDIMAPAGTPVLAAATGRIEKRFTSARGGLTLYERSADGGTVYYYAHLSAYAPGLVEGRAVRAGDEIAAVGATGDAAAAGPHLHFEVHRMAPGEGWWQGTEVDPYPLLKG